MGATAFLDRSKDLAASQPFGGDYYFCRDVELSLTAQLLKQIQSKKFDETAENRHHRRAWHRR
jgi:hypothetical protein